MAGMKIDFENAFNEVQRSVFLKECHDQFPQIFKQVIFVVPSTLFCFLAVILYHFDAVSNKGTLWVPFCFVSCFKSCNSLPVTYMLKQILSSFFHRSIYVPQNMSKKMCVIGQKCESVFFELTKVAFPSLSLRT